LPAFVSARRRVRGLAAAAACLLALLVTVPRAGAQTPGPSDPDQIFRSARKAWSLIAYSRYATYTVVIKFRNGQANVTRHYDAIADLRRDIVFARTFSREEIANPSIPHGISVKVGSVNGQGGAEANNESNSDRIGPLALSVNYSFGISLLPQKTQVVSSGKEIQFPPNLPIIGTTGTTTHDYTVRLIDTLAGGKTYHLGLEPTHDPGRLRLRQMWVDAATFVTKRILISGNFNKDPYTTVPWLIDFTRIGGADYITKETAEAPLDFDDNTPLPNVTIAFEDLKLLSAMPQYGSVGANDSSEALAEP
jgi:hypothetical protein